MLIIECPHCGPRTEDEYSYGGQAHIAYPLDPHALSDAEWAEYLFYRDNPKGSYAERWVHAAGCRKWFNVIRDTRTYEIQHVYRIGETPPGAAGSPPAAVTSTPSSNTPKED
jgi:heterotetrameric sarcosine oxidase delta subunit